MKPEIAISKEVFSQLGRLPTKVRKKVVEFVDKFQENPKSPAIHYEPISTFKDDKARTVRIGLDYRGILVSPRSGNRHLLVYVDHHDEAMAWAENKRFDVNPSTGVLQVVDVEQAEMALEELGQSAEQEKDWSAAFAHLEDEALVDVGVPEVLLPSVRKVVDEKSFFALAPHLPEEVRELLEWVVVHGLSLEQALEFSYVKRDPPKDPEDFGSALEKPDSLRQFVTLRSSKDLQEMLKAPLEAWRVFLHPDQRKLATKSFNGPARVLGGAGTGKTVLALHRAKWLADEVFTGEDDRVLLTTYSKSLAADIRENLKTLCSGEVHPRIEVTHLHSWAARQVQRGGARVQIAFSSAQKEGWKHAIGVHGTDRFSSGFIEDEWNDVVQQKGVRTKEAYLRTSRRGRGGPRLRKADREFLWEVFETYREFLDDRGLAEFPDIIRIAREQVGTGKAQLPYRAAIVDETQDFGANELKLIRAMIPEGENDLFFVGDAHQRIYAHPQTLSSCGIDIRGRGRKLRVNYRTTHEIRQFATAALKGVEIDDLDGHVDDFKGYKSLLSGGEPNIEWFDSKDEEVEAVAKQVQTLLDRGSESREVCIVAPAAWHLDNLYAPALKRAGLESLKLSTDDTASKESGVRLCTMHRVKGLEFRHILVCGLGDERFPYVDKDADPTDKVGARQHETQQRCLFFVAATRPRETLFVSGWGDRGYLP